MIFRNRNFLNKAITFSILRKLLQLNYLRIFSAYVFIYKDGNPDPIAQIPTEIKGAGFATISRGFQFDINSRYEMEVVLNYGTGVEIKSGKVEIPFANLYIEKQDPEYPDVKLNWDDYYPVLGGKVITVRTTKKALEGSVVKCKELESTTQALANLTPPAVLNGKGDGSN